MVDRAALPEQTRMAIFETFPMWLETMNEKWRLEELKEALSEELDSSIDQFFGGSVAKHTYVDGLSDIDSLLVINDPDLREEKPRAVLTRMEGILKEEIGTAASVSHGRMAVTVEYRDGMVIQLLPAIETEGDHIHVLSSLTGGWAKINPLAFQQALTKRNEQCAGTLVPTIKLAKAVVGQLPPKQTLSGYHIESLAIAAFRAYEGEKTTRAMLPVFFERARDLVLSPIRDRSGQSIHVDAYLGPENSEERQVVGHLLGRIARRMRNATLSASKAQWRALFGLDQ
jgi:predicted nucleotidyltransferase